MNDEHQAYYQSVIHQYFSKDEVKKLHQLSNWKAFLEISYNWLWIVASFALVYFFPNNLSVIIALFIIGGKQLGCAIIMHDAGHNSLFKSNKLNLIVGNIFGAYPIFMNVQAYGKYHLKHHQYAGLTDDPDTNLTKGYPTSKKSMLRKLSRDLFGITGIKGFVGLLAMHADYLQFELGGRAIKTNHSHSFLKRINIFIRNFSGPFFSNFALFLICLFLGVPLLYLLWIGAFFTTFYFCIRIRSITEHSIVPDKENPALNTRSTKAGFFAKLFFAPLQVNYHMEHHIMMSVPCYHLKEMHEILKNKGYYNTAPYGNSYWEVFKMAIIK